MSRIFKMFTSYVQSILLAYGETKMLEKYNYQTCNYALTCKWAKTVREILYEFALYIPKN